MYLGTSWAQNVWEHIGFCMWWKSLLHQKNRNVLGGLGKITDLKSHPWTNFRMCSDSSHPVESESRLKYKKGIDVKWLKTPSAHQRWSTILCAMLHSSLKIIWKHILYNIMRYTIDFIYYIPYSMQYFELYTILCMIPYTILIYYNVYYTTYYIWY